MRKNDVVLLTIESVNSEGAGVARCDGLVVFVPYALPGETVRAHIIKVSCNYAVGKISEVVFPSSDRVAPPCPYFYTCGGCDLQHAAYKAQVDMKCDAALKNIEKLSGLLLKTGSVLYADEPFAYRAKAQFPVGTNEQGAHLGFFAPRSHRLIALDACLLQDERLNAVIPAFEKACRACPVPVYNEETHRGVLRHVVARAGKGGIMAIFVTNSSKNLPDAFVKSFADALPGVTVLQNINTQKGNIILGKECRTLLGAGALEDELCGIAFTLRPLAFLQVNPKQTERLYDLAIGLAGLSGNETVLDAYCGIGLTSLIASRSARRVIGVEIVPEAIETARETAARNGIANTDFLLGACEDVLPRLVADGLRPDVVFVDPPRAGCEENFLRAVCDAGVPRIVYISCNPATLARDMRFLSQNGYCADQVHFADMFCQTKHIETVALLSRKNSDGKYGTCVKE